MKEGQDWLQHSLMIPELTQSSGGGICMPLEFAYLPYGLHLLAHLQQTVHLSHIPLQGGATREIAWGSKIDEIGERFILITILTCVPVQKAYGVSA